jgi:hypothetical protein
MSEKKEAEQIHNDERPINLKILIIGAMITLIGFFCIGLGIAVGDLLLDLLGIGITGGAVALTSAA